MNPQNIIPLLASTFDVAVVACCIAAIVITAACAIGSSHSIAGREIDEDEDEND